MTEKDPTTTGTCAVVSCGGIMPLDARDEFSAALEAGRGGANGPSTNFTLGMRIPGNVADPIAEARHRIETVAGRERFRRYAVDTAGAELRADPIPHDVRPDE